MKKKIFKISFVFVLSLLILTGCGEKKEKKEETKSNSNSNITENKVVSVSLDFVEKDSEKGNLVVNAVDKNKNVVWSFVYKSDIPVGIGLTSIVATDGEKYFYLNSDNGIKAYDRETGKEVWENSDEVSKKLYGGEVKELNNKAFIYTGAGGGFEVQVYDMNDGKYLGGTGVIDELINIPNKNYVFGEYLLDNGILKINVEESNDSGETTGKAGYVEIDSNTYKAKFVQG